MLDQIPVNGEAIVQPPADEVAGRAAAMNNLMMTSATAEITCPAASAWFLLVYVPSGEPSLLDSGVNSSLNVTKSRFRIFNKTMTSEKSAFGGKTKVAGAGAARIRTVGTTMKLLERFHNVGKRVVATGQHLGFELVPAVNHLGEHPIEMRHLHLKLA